MIDEHLSKKGAFEAVVLAGGFGTRLSSVVSDVPKPMTPVAGKPFLEWLLESLYYRGCRRTVLATGYLSEKIEQHFGKQFRGIEIVYSKEEEPLGTGGAIKKALSFCENDTVLVLNGDTFFDADIQGLFDILEKQNCSLALALRHVSDVSRYGSVEIEDGFVKRFQEKNLAGQGFVAGGMYAMKQNLLDAMPEKFSFETDFEESYIETSPVGAFVDNGYFIDIGIPADYAKAKKDFETGFRKAAFFDRDGTINIDTGHLFEPSKLQFVNGAPKVIRKHNHEGNFVVVVTNQAGIAKGIYSEADMHELHAYLNERLRIEHGAHIDAFHYCPHHPDFTGTCECRKPAAGLLQEASSMHGINLAKSVMYGDKESDKHAAKAAGIGTFYSIDSKKGFSLE